MPLKIIDHGGSEYKQMVELREAVLRRPLGLGFTHNELENEKNDLLIGAFEENNILGCCILIAHDKNTMRLRQMAVWDTLQGKGVGKAIIQFAEKIAHDRGFSRIIMNARKYAIGFYERMGYRVCSDEFMEVTIPHVIMEKEI